MTSNAYVQALEKKGRPLFIPFTVLGDPNKEQSLEVMQTLVQSGADALELGFPYSDPPADGPVIQAADVRALQAGIKSSDCFDLIKSIREQTDIPIGLLVYYNLVLQRGVDTFYADCKEAGVTSVLVADLPVEHIEEILPASKKHGIDPVFIISELTTDERFQKIANIADGYLYLVSYLGVTGVDNSVLKESIESVVRRARKHTSLPICVGFGISSAEHIKAAEEAGADGAIVGSRIVKEVPSLSKIAEVCEMLQSM